MSKFLELEYWSKHVIGRKTEEDSKKEKLWINTNCIVSYYSTSKSLWFEDEEHMTLTDDGEKTLLEYFKEQS